MQINLNNAYDNQGNIKDSLSQHVDGYKYQTPLLPDLQFIEQYIVCNQKTLLTEQAPKGLYFTMTGETPIDTVEDIKSLSVCYIPKDIVGHFGVKENEERSLVQIHITPEHLANVLGESEEQVTSYFSLLFQTLSQGDNVITLPITKRNKAASHSLLINTEQNLSLAGHIYAFIFVLIQQLKMLNHITNCDNCQSKIFKAQNLLEVPDHSALKISTLAQEVELNEEALILGFHHVVGESVAHYCARSRLQYAASKLRKNPQAKIDILANSGLSESQFESAFIQHFGVNSQQYGQVH